MVNVSPTIYITSSAFQILFVILFYFLGKPVTMINRYKGPFYGGSKAVDGIMRKSYFHEQTSLAHTHLALNAWIQIDLEYGHCVTAVTVRNRDVHSRFALLI